MMWFIVVCLIAPVVLCASYTVYDKWCSLGLSLIHI